VSRRFVSEHRDQFPTTRLCRLVGVSRSSFYEWASRPLSDHYFDDAALAAEIHEIHVASRRTYGAPRVAGQLHNRGRHHGTKRVARIMAECGLVGVHGRRKWCRGKANPAPGPDLLKRDFTAERSDQRWVADITEFRCWDGKLYLAGIVDLHDHSIVGWSMGQRQTTDLVVSALVMALGRRMPDGDLLHHADRGGQGELNRSSQHLSMMEVRDGATAAGGGQGASSGDAIAGAADPGASRRARVLASDRPRHEHRGRSCGCRGVGPRRVALVSPRWRDDAFAPRRTDRPVLVVR
jgi:transposase InsO family protein